jgi:hypothetical protein
MTFIHPKISDVTEIREVGTMVAGPKEKTFIAFHQILAIPDYVGILKKGKFCRVVELNLPESFSYIV